MNDNKTNVLTINGGSSSIKFALYKMGEPMVQLFNGAMENIGTNNAKIDFTDTVTQQKESFKIILPENDNAADVLIECLQKKRWL